MGTGYPTGYGVNPRYVSGICQHRSQPGPKLHTARRLVWRCRDRYCRGLVRSDLVRMRTSLCHRPPDWWKKDYPYCRRTRTSGRRMYLRQPQREVTMTSSKSTASKTTTRARTASRKPTVSARKPAPANKPDLKARLLKMEKSLEKGAAEFGHRIKEEMPVVKAKVVKAGKAVAKKAVEVERGIKKDVIEVKKKLEARKSAHASKKPGVKKPAAKKTAVKKPTAIKPASKRASAKKTVSRRKPVAGKSSRRPAVKKSA